jgi:hypothetical protein
LPKESLVSESLVPSVGVLQPEYEQWLERLASTHRALIYTCRHRLGSQSLAEQVSVQVVAGLLARPKIFRYFGLPFSGRIARFAEQRIAEAKAGRLRCGCNWGSLWFQLHELSREQQCVFVGICVEGHSDAELAGLLQCTEAAAKDRREQTLAVVGGIANRALAPAVDDLTE